MATFLVSSQIAYNSSGAFSPTATTDVDPPASVTDGDSDSTFEQGDTVVGLTYRGLFDMPLASGGTETLPVFSDATRFFILASQPLSAYSPPATINPAALDPSQSFTVCFLPATAIATPDGERPVETLAIGDLVLTADGRSVAVKWLGRQTLSTRFARHAVIRIHAGALGAGLPRRDLRVTADHALLIDGLLVNAGALVNGTTVTREPAEALGDTFMVYHVETEAHEIILAEGAATETYIDYVERRAFDNHAEYMALYGDAPHTVEAAYPRICAARHLPPALRLRLAGCQAA